MFSEDCCDTLERNLKRHAAVHLLASGKREKIFLSRSLQSGVSIPSKPLAKRKARKAIEIQRRAVVQVRWAHKRDRRERDRERGREREREKEAKRDRGNKSGKAMKRGKTFQREAIRSGVREMVKRARSMVNAAALRLF